MKNNAVLFAFISLLVFGCGYDNKEVQPVISPTVDQIIADFKPVPEVFTISDTKKFKTKSGIYFWFPTDPFGFIHEDGSEAGYPLRVEVNSMLTMGDMIRNQAPTVGPEGIFISGGQFSIKASSNGLPVKMANGSNLIDVFMPALPVFASQPIPGFGIWKGTQNTDGSLVWNQAISPNFPQPWPDTARLTTVMVDTTLPMQLGYLFQIQNLFFTNLDIYFPRSEPKVEVSIQMPVGFSDLNARCYLAIPSINSVAHIFNFDAGSNEFTTNPYYQVPIGLETKVVVIAKRDNTYYSTVQPYTVDSKGILRVDLKPTTKEAINAALDKL